MMFDALTSVNRLFDFYKLQNQESTIKTLIQNNSSTTLEIQKLNLHLDDAHVLKNIDLSIHKNEIVALIGPVGSGKSLLLKSILNETTVVADHLYHAQCSYLPQEPFILSSTIKDNISLTYDSTDKDSDCLLALENAEFDILADRLPEGLKTSIGERGLNLSGGQKQRLNLSRIFFRPQPLILLDDPFSAVDVGTEAQLIRNIQALQRHGHSFLVTTQRYSFLEYCDRVVFLERGEILFDGQFKDFKTIEKFRNFFDVMKKNTSPYKFSKSIYNTLLQCYRPFIYKIIFLVIIGFLGRLILLSNAQLIARFVDQHVVLNKTILSELIWQLFILLVISFVFTIFYRTVFSRLSSLAVSRLYDETTYRVSRYPMDFFDTTPVGQITTRFSSDYGNVFRLFGGPLAEFLSIFFDLVSIVIVISFVHPIFLISLLCSGLLFRIILKKIKTSSEKNVLNYPACGAHRWLTFRKRSRAVLACVS